MNADRDKSTFARMDLARAGRFLATRGGWVVVAVVSLLLGMLLQAAFTPKRPVARGQADGHGRRAEIEEWTCSMHPQVRRSKPGLCPICNMDLVTVTDQGGARGAPVFTTSRAGAAMMDIRTTPAERRYVTRDVRMVGKVDYDETKLASIAAWVPGRIDRLYVDSTGVPVSAGEHLADLYSPDLLAAQEEYIQARRAVEGLAANGGGIVAESTRATLEAAREKLRLLGISQEQVATIAQRGKADDHMTISSPVGGIVVDKHAREGMYVRTGMRIYTVADLSQVWVRLDAYESDLAWLRYGQPVDLTTVAYPGETFSGTISLIHPVLDAGTRTVSLRVNVPNPDGRLKPGMFIRAVARSRLAGGGRVMEPQLADKYICTMHPEVIAGEPGQCPECGMDLVATSALGYVSADEAAEVAPLVIPASAPLVTGRRAIVYVADPTADVPTYEGRQIVLGPRAGEWYIVREGLKAGERVVVRGNFLIDSALQIQLRPSLISRIAESPVETAAARTPAPPAELGPEFIEALGKALDGYVAIQRALANDNLDTARRAAADAGQAIAAVDVNSLDGKDRQVWTRRAEAAGEALSRLGGADDIQAARSQFLEISQQVTALLRRFGAAGRTLNHMHCPMAFNNAGADWLQVGETVANPYFGERMLRCGEVVETFEPAAANAGGNDE
ncbi:MAG: DUF3347 domain-containing protein [Planctomycetes bacterium]|jgi:Cu(I)/Ag(I) efflux system membrane fusion protein|nr:DUF3347 domain-containing protein [Planctomycetota bacterium]